MRYFPGGKARTFSLTSSLFIWRWASAGFINPSLTFSAKSGRFFTSLSPRATAPVLVFEAAALASLPGSPYFLGLFVLTRSFISAFVIPAWASLRFRLASAALALVAEGVCAPTLCRTTFSDFLSSPPTWAHFTTGFSKGHRTVRARSTLRCEMPTTIAVSLAEADLPEPMPSFDGIG